MNSEKGLLTYLKNKEYAEGAFIFGSYARNPEGKHNDIDVFVLINENWWKRESKVINGIEHELFYFPSEYALNILKTEKDFNMAGWFMNTKIILDKNNSLSEFIPTAKEIVNKKLEEFDAEWWAYKIGDRLQDIEQEREDETQKLFLMNCLLKEILFVFFLSKKILPVKENYFVKKIAKLDPKLYSLINRFYESKQLNDKMAVLNKMIIQLNIGKPTTKLTTIKIELKD
ncbi:Uncharacterised protein [uncultured archaeon]|nr:Uncharacterised protein [uncultured archaeon]